MREVERDRQRGLHKERKIKLTKPCEKLGKQIFIQQV